MLTSNYYVGDDPFSVKGCIDQFRYYGTSPHFMIARDGRIIKMVDEKNVAWHAGKSLLPGTDRDSLNRTSIGIELINTKTIPPSEEQYQSLMKLCRHLCARWGIHYIVRHRDIAPGRKTDPWCFDWEWFKRQMFFYHEELEFPE